MLGICYWREGEGGGERRGKERGDFDGVILSGI